MPMASSTIAAGAVHVIWDMGGTLFDSYTPIDELFARMASAAGVPMSRLAVARLTRVSISSAMQELAARTSRPEADYARAYERLKESWQHDPAPVMPGAREVLAAVHAHGGKNLIVTHRDRASASALLSASGLAARIDAMICAPDGYPRKPSPAMFHEMLHLAQVSAAQTIAVGDRQIDVQAAHGAGIKAALLVTEGLPIQSSAHGAAGGQSADAAHNAESTQSTQRPAGADWTIYQLPELLPLITRQPAPHSH